MSPERPSPKGSAFPTLPVLTSLTAVALVSLIAVASGDTVSRLLPGFLAVGGLALAGLGLVALLRGRVRWARLNRQRGALFVAAGLIAALVGGGFSGQGASTIAAAPTPTTGKGASAPTLSPSAATALPPEGTGTSPGADLPAIRPTNTAGTNGLAEPSSSPAQAGSALTALTALTVKGRAPRTGYDRALFGQAWADVDRNGCDTRNDVLRRDLTAYHLKAGTHGCLVLSGTLSDPYTATTIAFVRGEATSAQVQIDHVVALSDAWQKGAQQWSTQRRILYANDSLNLLAVDGLTNQRKSDGDAATWLPPEKRYRCSYTARQVAVKAKYGLWVTAAEREALARILKTCPSQGLPTAGVFVLGGASGRSAGPVERAPAGGAKPFAPKARPSTDPRFATCSAAKAAGFGPYQTGQHPEYGWYRDGDGDGVVCE